MSVWLIVQIIASYILIHHSAIQRNGTCRVMRLWSNIGASIICSSMIGQTYDKDLIFKKDEVQLFT